MSEVDALIGPGPAAPRGCRVAAVAALRLMHRRRGREPRPPARARGAARALGAGRPPRARAPPARARTAHAAPETVVAVYVINDEAWPSAAMDSHADVQVPRVHRVAAARGPRDDQVIMYSSLDALLDDAEPGGGRRRAAAVVSPDPRRRHRDARRSALIAQKARARQLFERRKERTVDPFCAVSGRIAQTRRLLAPFPSSGCSPRRRRSCYADTGLMACRALPADDPPG